MRNKANNTNKTLALLHTTGGEDEPNIIYIHRNGRNYIIAKAMSYYEIGIEDS
jgi:hypothetical protein